MATTIKARRERTPIDPTSLLHKEILSSREAAAFLDISMNQLYKLSAGAKVPTYRPSGGKVYYLKSELHEWVLSGRRATVKDINSLTIKSLNSKN